MKYFKPVIILFVVCICLSCDKDRDKSSRILVFSKTAGFRHSSIPQGRTAILELGRENGFKVDTTENSSQFNIANLKRYAAVVFLNTTGDVLNAEQQRYFEEYIRGGGGYAGVHSASDTEYDWPWYGKLVGAYFASHPKQQEAKLQVVDQEHLSTKHLPAEWNRKDEWYNFKNINPATTVLITIDEHSYTGGTNGDQHPMSWFHSYDGGRAWYTALGHTEDSYTEQAFLNHLLGGIQYAMGKAEN
ncbi:ThuA domain-containing protein [Pseudoflavitalea rhizosphaerae]|uniref:ThuA domain-containing protein n=1 Tax=Pseudoflavitalea rhizosphaerae TaxID=1884793 RepID=UPI000F8DAD9A|nr:ThuA domain-containing protein [Pseudoflavitalea rhizosphaerae]